MFHDFNTSADVLSFKFCEKHGDTRKNEDGHCKWQKNLQDNRKVESINEKDFVGPDGCFLFQESFHADEYYLGAVWVEENICCGKLCAYCLEFRTGVSRAHTVELQHE